MKLELSIAFSVLLSGCGGESVDISREPLPAQSSLDALTEPDAATPGGEDEAPAVSPPLTRLVHRVHTQSDCNTVIGTYLPESDNLPVIGIVVRDADVSMDTLVGVVAYGEAATESEWEPSELPMAAQPLGVVPFPGGLLARCQTALTGITIRYTLELPQ